MSDPVVVSMYNVGFGDCFLLRLPGAERERKVLIDCGSIKGGDAGGTDAIVEQVIEDVTEADGPRIDVVAVTHRHRDHVSGFEHPAWKDVRVDEVWLPWVEDPTDDAARTILEKMAGFASALQMEAQRLPGTPYTSAEQELLGHVVTNTLGLTNEKAMDTVHRGFKQPRKAPRFLHRSSTPLETKVLAGVTVHVLAPSKETKVIREMNPPSDQSFLRIANGVDQVDDDDLLPFEADPGPLTVLGSDPPDFQRFEEITGFLRRFAGESAIFGAVALESAVNNTSLMLVFEIGDAVLLFPGDSQWGSWDINLQDPLRASLLERTTFYKVGHHGSHNSTPVDFVHKHLNAPGGPTGGIWAAASVVPHGSFDDIPRGPLLEQLREKIADPRRVVRSDDAPTKANAPQGLTVLRKGRKVIRVDFEVPID